MRYQELLESISKGKIAPAYFLCGEEDFLREDTLKKIISSQVKPGFRSFDLDILYGEDVNLAVLRSRAETLPMGSERRLVILRNLERLAQGDKRKLLNYLDSPPPKTLLVLVAGKVDLHKGFYKELSKKTASVVFWPLSDREVPTWVARYLKDRGLRIDEDALYLLQNAVGNDLFSLVNELDKVSLYVGAGGRIGPEHIRSVVGSARIDSVFDLNLALGLGELDKALRVIGNLIDWGENPNRIIYMVARHLFNLKKLNRVAGKDAAPGGLAKQIGVPRKYIGDYLRQVERLSEKDMNEGLRAVYQAEVALKSRKINERLLLELMGISICRPGLRTHMPVFHSGQH